MIINKKLKYNKAFTLVETLVAISIFTGSLLGLLSLTAGNISDTNYAKDKLVANYLATEGIEYIRNLRDTYVLFESDGWTAFKNKISPCSDGCYFNADAIVFTDDTQPMKDIVISSCSPTCPSLLYNKTSLTKQYNYTTGSLTTFVRKISIKELPTGSIYNKEIAVLSTVSWKTKGKDYSVSFIDYLKNWAE